MKEKKDVRIRLQGASAHPECVHLFPELAQGAFFSRSTLPDSNSATRFCEGRKKLFSHTLVRSLYPLPTHLGYLHGGPAPAKCPLERDKLWRLVVACFDPADKRRFRGEGSQKRERESNRLFAQLHVSAL